MSKTLCPNCEATKLGHIIKTDSLGDCPECGKFVSKSMTIVGSLEDLIDRHWAYIKNVLTNHAVAGSEISRIGFHYKTAFHHGYKHAVEDIEKHNQPRSFTV